MNSPIDPHIDELVASAVVEDCGNFKMIKIPGIERFSESEALAIFRRADRLLFQKPAFDVDVLQSKLREITPCPSDGDGEDAEESRQMEAQARKDLESDGCPPCYPAYIPVPIRNPPEEFKPIIEYWESDSGTGDVILCAQRYDWQAFRAYQLHMRQRFRDDRFSKYVDMLRTRRRRQGLEDAQEVNFSVDVQRQSRLENWIEFQNYQLRRAEDFDKERTWLEAERVKKEMGVSGSGMQEVEQVPWTGPQKPTSLECNAYRSKWHRVLLEWIQQQRLEMGSVKPPLSPVSARKESNNHFDDVRAVRRISSRTCRHRPKKPDTSRSTILGNVRISKSRPRRKQQKMQSPTPNRAENGTVVKDLKVMTPSNDDTKSSNTRHISQRRQTKSRRARDKPLGPANAQRVSKVKRGSTDRGRKLRSGMQSRSDRGPFQNATGARRSQITSASTAKRRSERTRKTPVRWGFE